MRERRDGDGREKELERLVRRHRDGDRAAGHELFVASLAELRGCARRVLRGRERSLGLEPDDLVQMAYLKVFGRPRAGWNSWRHFLAYWTQTMRCIVFDRVRSIARSPNAASLQTPPGDDGRRARLSRIALEVRDAIERLGLSDRRAAAVAWLHGCEGRTIRDVAQTMCLSVRTTERSWAVARNRLRALLAG